MIDFAPVEGCINPDSYGTICVKCNKCHRFDEHILIILGCSKKKARAKSKAIEMYQGALFKAGIKFANSFSPPAKIAIISAKYGILDQDDVIEPYDLTLTCEQVEKWLQDSTFQVKLHTLISKDLTRIYLIMGKTYRELFKYVEDRRFVNIFKLGGIGMVLRWLKNNSKNQT